ncbi:sugar lactone lactonase YvrE [Dysgonomonas hofstadii]|uniref:Sugar lactone lactonase YvrE n=1 Tax=Dysgonomonas hofstadii TaxID=637886 RepID=A0A840CE10_9BACT|nr:IPT/TIG domain-containing protein [Dysgonomonas hofstadii]MBB4034180.1 sugar lactone lactonase YvrE [Dysgonomonas hofstadii]
MKIKNIITGLLAGCLILSCLLTSCKDDNDDTPSTLVVNKFYPTSGGAGTEILITGKNFTDDTSRVSVMVGETPLKIIGSNSTGIMVVVPRKLGSGLLHVKIGDQETTSVEEFTYTFSATVTTLAGNGKPGYVDGEGTEAQFYLQDTVSNWRKGSICVDLEDNIYVGDAGNNCIRKITPDGKVTTLAGRQGNYGHADGTGTAARFQEMYGMDCDSEGNIYVSDLGNPQTIRKVTSEGVVTTIKDNIWPYPWYLAVDKRNGNIYTANPEKGGIYQLKPDGTMTHIIQNVSIAGLVVDPQGNLFAIDFDTNQIVKYEADTWSRSTIAGSEYGYEDGPTGNAKFAKPWGMALDGDGNIYVAGNGIWDGGDNPDQSIRIVDMKSGVVRTVAGSAQKGYVDANGSSAAFNAPLDLAINKDGIIYVFDRKNNAIRRIMYE